MYYYMDLDYDKIKKYYDVTIKNDLDDLQDVINNDKVLDLKVLVDKIVRIYPFISLGQLAGHYEKISKRVKDFLLNFRYNHDSIIHDFCDYIILNIKNSLPDKYKEYINFITLDEALNKLPSIEDLKMRQSGYIFFGKLFVVDDYEKWFSDNNISINDDKSSSLKGDVAYSESVSGKVCIVYSEKDFSKFKKGDILVTPMTVPKFMKVIKMAKGIITDEGGITCHACIIARELKIPCVIGCKNATKILKDGDFVKIDGATGNVTILTNN